MQHMIVPKMLLFSLGGVFVGGLHATVGYISEPATAAVTLCVDYDHLHRDQVLLTTLAEIDAEFYTVDPVAAWRAITAMDKLVGLRMELTGGTRVPTVSDQIMGMEHAARAKRSLQRFVSQVEQVGDPRRVIYIQRRAQGIMTQLASHMESIVMATRDVHIRP